MKATSRQPHPDRVLDCDTPSEGVVRINPFMRVSLGWPITMWGNFRVTRS